MDELNEFEADDSSVDSTYVPMDDDPSDSYYNEEDDDIDCFVPENVYENNPNMTSTTAFCSSNVRDEYKMATSQESELPIEPIDEFETTITHEGFDTLSDKDGGEKDRTSSFPC